MNNLISAWKIISRKSSGYLVLCGKTRVKTGLSCICFYCSFSGKVFMTICNCQEQNKMYHVKLALNFWDESVNLQQRNNSPGTSLSSTSALYTSLIVRLQTLFSSHAPQTMLRRTHLSTRDTFERVPFWGCFANLIHQGTSEGALWEISLEYLLAEKLKENLFLRKLNSLKKFSKVNNFF